LDRKEAVMLVRRLLWLVVLMLLVVVLAGGGALAWLLLRSRAQPARLVVLGPNKQVRLLDTRGSEQVLAENAKTDGFSFPATAPDQRHLAYVTEDDSGAAIIALDVVSGERKEIYHSSENLPIDLAWSPDGKYIVFLAGEQLAAQIVPADGSQPARLIAAGAPSYFAWSPDSGTLLLHLGGHTAQGGHVATFRPGETQSHQLLSDPGFFQAPAWAVDGQHFFYVAQPPITSAKPTIDDIKSDIMRVSTEGKDPTMLVREEKSDLRIIRAPNSDQIAYSILGLESYGPLKLIDGAGGTARTLSHQDDHVTAFFWSPDGTQIAYLTYADAYDHEGPRTWHIVDVTSGAIRDLGTFTPSAAFVGLQDFFDAYTFSFSPWAPDGARLAYGANDGVYIIDTAAGSATKQTDGVLGMWVGGS
jgi:TolB protein